jgi:predicted MFS family arabinose efflux permease
LGKAMANRSLWMISISFLCFNLVLMALSSFYPDFLNTVRHFSLASASFMTSLMMIVAIISGPIGGYISDRLGKRKVLIVVPFILAGLVYLFPFTATGWMIPAIMVIAGIVAGPIAPVSLAAVPEIMVSPRLAGIGMGVAALGQNVGMFIGPALFGRLVETTTWTTAGYLMTPVCLIGVITAWLAKIR